MIDSKDVESRKGEADSGSLSYGMVLKTNVEDLAVFRKWMKDAMTALSRTEVIRQVVSSRCLEVNERSNVGEGGRDE